MLFEVVCNHAHEKCNWKPVNRNMFNMSFHYIVCTNFSSIFFVELLNKSIYASLSSIYFLWTRWYFQIIFYLKTNSICCWWTLHVWDNQLLHHFLLHMTFTVRSKVRSSSVKRALFITRLVLLSKMCHDKVLISLQLNFLVYSLSNYFSFSVSMNFQLRKIKKNFADNKTRS